MCLSFNRLCSSHSIGLVFVQRGDPPCHAVLRVRLPRRLPRPPLCCVAVNGKRLQHASSPAFVEQMNSSRCHCHCRRPAECGKVDPLVVPQTGQHAALGTPHPATKNYCRASTHLDRVLDHIQWPKFDAFCVDRYQQNAGSLYSHATTIAIETWRDVTHHMIAHHSLALRCHRSVL